MTNYALPAGSHNRPPNLFIVGAPKCGTTAMCQYLSHHPDIFAPDRKEFHHLCPDLSYHFRVDDRSEYLSHFNDWSTEAWAIDGSVFYLYSEVASQRIKEFSPESRIIIMLRNPVDVLYALHKQWVFNGYENLTDFEEALAAEPVRKNGLNMPSHCAFPCGLVYRDACRFTQQVERYLDVFGSENVHVIVYDDFVQDTAAAYQDTLKFLEVAEHSLPAFDRINSVPEFRSATAMRLVKRPPPLLRSTVRSVVPRRILEAIKRMHDQFNPVHRPPRMPTALYRELQLEFEDEVRSLGTLLNRDLAHWVERV